MNEWLTLMIITINLKFQYEIEYITIDKNI